MNSQSDLLQAAFAAHDQRDWAQAAGYYRRYLGEGGTIRNVANALGDVLSELMLLRDARDVYAAGHDVEPENAGTAFRLGRAAERLSDWRMARSATRVAALNADAEDQALAHSVGPLPLCVSKLTIALLSLEGWVSSDLQTLSEETTQSESPELSITKIDSAPKGTRLRLVSSARWQGGGLSSAEAISLARFAESAAPCAAVTLLFYEDTPQGQAEASVLRGTLQRAGVCAKILTHHGEATTLQLHSLALHIAAAYGADALCATAIPLHAVFPPLEAFSEDPMLGFAYWRPARGETRWSRTSCRAAPLVLIRDRVLHEAGQLDHYYKTFDSALSDLMLRANRLGFSAVSHAADYPSAIPSASDVADERLLHLRYPEHNLKLRQSAASVSAEVSRLTRALTTPRDLALDLSGLRAWHDGTSALSVAIAGALSRDPRFDLKLLCNEEAASHHGLHQLAGARVVAPESRPLAAACFKVGQPFTWEELLFTWSTAPVAGFYMLDAISLDVERLSVDVDLDLLWRLLFEHSEIIGHLSRYTRDQMGRRFGDAGARGFVALCSTAVDEYATVNAQATEDVLLVGNAYEHKNLLGAIRAIHTRSPDQKLTVLGRVLEARRNVTWLDSGALPHGDLQRRYAEAQAVVFPSLYEGFGLPIMHGLAARRPVLAIDQPVFREIKERSRWGAGLHLFPDTASLAAGLQDVCRAGFPEEPAAIREQRWSDAARVIGDAVLDAVADFDPARLARRVAVLKAVEPLHGGSAI